MTIPISMPSETHGWPVAAPRKPKKTRWMIPVEDLADILGGLATTLGRVSRMEVREGMMGAPDMVVSQYRWFCDEVLSTLTVEVDLETGVLRLRR